MYAAVLMYAVKCYSDYDDYANLSRSYSLNFFIHLLTPLLIFGQFKHWPTVHLFDRAFDKSVVHALEAFRHFYI